MSLMDFKLMPKVELHCHLEACFKPETVMEIGRTLGLSMPQDLATFRNEWLLSKPLGSLHVALARFVDIQKIWCSEEVIERMTFEACEYSVDQGIRIMEFRYAPNFIAADKRHLDFEKIHAAVLRGVHRGAHPNLAIGLIGIVQKTLPLNEAWKTIEFIIENADTFVGLDFADQDTMPLATYAPLVEKAHEAGLHLTIHAGEVPGPGSSQEVRDAIEVLNAERIGHGIHIINDIPVMDLCKEKNVTLEICPTSNWLTSAVPTTATHPIKRLMKYGVPITINSDDPSLFGIDLCHEYEILYREHGFTEKDFHACNQSAANASFIDAAEKSRVWHNA